MDDREAPCSDVSAEPSFDSQDGLDGLPRAKRFAPSGSFDSPQRHRQRDIRARRPVKETLDARSEYTTSQDDGTAEHRINQYVIRQEIGRGSFGAVHLAADQFGKEYAVKEFSKSRLRKRAQSHLLRRPRGPRRPGIGFNSPLHRHPSGNDDNENSQNPLYLIKEEIAIMKKLNHNNLVSLIEVLDDPTEDSLYMVMEMCKKGVVMKVGLEDQADPYDDEHCRCWFRDLILGIEYLHAQGIVHRDIKPDNCLVTNDDVLKVVDFGVSEMFEKNSTMFTAKSAGSPAFLPPELCVVRHGDVSGKAADIWSMGVTLYCLRYGRLPFDRQNIFDLYESIRNDSVVCEEEQDEDFKDLMHRILEKDPGKRIKMRDLRVHPWVTMDGADPLLPWEENAAHSIEPPTEDEMNKAITKNMGSLMTFMKAVKNFKRLMDPSKSGPPMQSILGGEHEAHFVEPPMEMDDSEDFPTIGLDAKAQSGPHPGTGIKKFLARHPFRAGSHDRRDDLDISETTSVSSRPEHSPAGSQRPSGVWEPERKDLGSIHSRRSFVHEARRHSQSASPLPLSRANSTTTKRSVEGTKGHARDPLEEEFPYLFIGPSTYDGHSPQEDSDFNSGVPIFAEPETADDGADDGADEGDVEGARQIVSESPGAADFDIYETAYAKELERIKTNLTFPGAGAGPKVYLTRRVEGRDEVMKFAKDKSLDLQVGQRRLLTPSSSRGSGGSSAFSAAVSLLRNQIEQKKEAGESIQEQRPDHPGSEARQRNVCPGSHPPSSSLSSQLLPDPEASSLEATGVPATDIQSNEASTAQLRRLLSRVREKSGQE